MRVCVRVGCVRLLQVTCVPEVHVRERQPGDELLVLACDGVWDVLTNDDLASFVRDFELRSERVRGVALLIPPLLTRAHVHTPPRTLAFFRAQHLLTYVCARFCVSVAGSPSPPRTWRSCLTRLSRRA